MAWCLQATSHYLSQCWPRSLSPYGVTRPQCVKLTFPYHLIACPVPDYDDRRIVLGHIKLLILITSFIWKKSTNAFHYRHSSLVVKAITLIFCIWHESECNLQHIYDNVMKWKHFPRCRSFLKGNHWSLVYSPHKGQWHGPLMYSLIYAWTNAWVNNREASDLRRHCAHYDVTEMSFAILAHKPSY